MFLWQLLWMLWILVYIDIRIGELYCDWVHARHQGVKKWRLAVWRDTATATLMGKHSGFQQSMYLAGNLYSASSVMTFHTISLFLSLQKHYIRIKMMMGKKVESVLWSRQVFSRNDIPISAPLSLHNENIKSVRTHKHLGIFLSEKLDSLCLLKSKSKVGCN